MHQAMARVACTHSMHGKSACTQAELVTVGCCIQMIAWSLLLPQHVHLHRDSIDPVPTSVTCDVEKEDGGGSDGGGSASVLHDLFISVLTKVVRRPHEALAFAYTAVLAPLAPGTRAKASCSHAHKRLCTNRDSASACASSQHQGGAQVGNAADTAEVERVAAHRMLLIVMVEAVARLFRGHKWRDRGLDGVNTAWMYLSGVVAMSGARNGELRALAAALLALVLQELSSASAGNVASFEEQDARAEAVDRGGKRHRRGEGDGGGDGDLKVVVAEGLWGLAAFLQHMSALAQGVSKGGDSRISLVRRSVQDWRAVQVVLQPSSESNAHDGGGTHKAALAWCSRLDDPEGRWALLTAIAYLPHSQNTGAGAEAMSRPIPAGAQACEAPDCSTMRLALMFSGKEPAVARGGAHGGLQCAPGSGMSVEELERVLASLPSLHASALFRLAHAVVTGAASNSRPWLHGCSQHVATACIVCSCAEMACEDASEQALKAMAELDATAAACTLLAVAVQLSGLKTAPQQALPILLRACSEVAALTPDQRSITMMPPFGHVRKAAAALLEAGKGAEEVAKSHAIAALATETGRLLRRLPRAPLAAALVAQTTSVSLQPVVTGVTEALVLAEVVLSCDLPSCQQLMATPGPRMASQLLLTTVGSSLSVPGTMLPDAVCVSSVVQGLSGLLDLALTSLHPLSKGHQKRSRRATSVPGIERLLHCAFPTSVPPTLLHAHLRVMFAEPVIAAAVASSPPHPCVATAAAVTVSLQPSCATLAVRALSTLITGSDTPGATVFEHWQLLAAVLAVGCATGVGGEVAAGVGILAAQVRPIALKALLGEHDVTLAAVTLSRLCLCLKPLQQGKVSAFMCKCAPASGLRLSATTATLPATFLPAPSSSHAPLPPQLHRFLLAMELLHASAATALPALAIPRSSRQCRQTAEPGLEPPAVLPAAASEAQLCQWSAILLRCAVHTFSGSPPPARPIHTSGADAAIMHCGRDEHPCEGMLAHSAAQNLVDVVHECVDGDLGDVVSAIGRGGLASSDFSALAEPAVEYLEAVTGAETCDAESVRSVRRLWAALFRSEEDVVVEEDSDLGASDHEDMPHDAEEGRGSGESSDSPSNDSGSRSGDVADGRRSKAVPQAQEGRLDDSDGTSQGSHKVAELDGQDAPAVSVPLSQHAAQVVLSTNDGAVGACPSATGHTNKRDSAPVAVPRLVPCNPAVGAAAVRAIQHLLQSRTALAALFEEPFCDCELCQPDSSITLKGTGGPEAANEVTSVAPGVRGQPVGVSDDCAAVPADVRALQWPLESMVLVAEVVPLGTAVTVRRGLRCELLSLLEVRPFLQRTVHVLIEACFCLVPLGGMACPCCCAKQ
jgi:hypothetical protein